MSPATIVCMLVVAGIILLSNITDALYNNSAFGGLVIDRTDYDNAILMEDLKDKVVAAITISGFGTGLMQSRNQHGIREQPSSLEAFISTNEESESDVSASAMHTAFDSSPSRNPEREQEVRALPNEPTFTNSHHQRDSQDGLHHQSEDTSEEDGDGVLKRQEPGDLDYGYPGTVMDDRSSSSDQRTTLSTEKKAVMRSGAATSDPQTEPSFAHTTTADCLGVSYREFLVLTVLFAATLAAAMLLVFGSLAVLEKMDNYWFSSS